MKVRVFRLALLPASARRPQLIRKACLAAIRLEKTRTRGELNIIFLDRKRMREMNREFLKHDYDTDVIAFKYDGERRSVDAPFGDVYISAHMARRQARELDHSVLDEALTLAVHGTLHLLGYDDHTQSQRRRMFTLQERILRRC